MNNLIFLAKASEFVDPVGTGTAWADRLARFTGLGIQTFILGMLTVFAVLAILWGCLEVFRYVFYTIPEKKKAEAAAQAAPDAAKQNNNKQKNKIKLLLALKGALLRIVKSVYGNVRKRN